MRGAGQAVARLALAVAPHARRVWVAAGYSGHGNVLGFASGELVARALTGDRHPILDLLDPARSIAPAT